MGSLFKNPGGLRPLQINLQRRYHNTNAGVVQGAHAPCQGRVTSASENYIPLMAQVVIEALLYPSAGPPLTHVSRPSGNPVQLQALAGSVSQDVQLDLSFATEDAEERGLIGLSQCGTEGNSPSTS